MPWVSMATKLLRPERARALIPDILFIEFDLVSLEKSPKFILKRNLFVVLALVANILTDFPNRGLAHRKCPITALPVEALELRITITQPIVGALFYLADDIADGFSTRHYK